MYVLLAISVVTLARSVHRPRGDNEVHIWVPLKRRCVLCGRVLKRGNNGDGCEWESTLCKYDLRKYNLFLLIWTSVRRVRRRSVASELLMRGMVCAVISCCLL